VRHIDQRRHVWQGALQSVRVRWDVPLQVLALVFTFGSQEPGVQVLVLVLLCVGVLVAHCVIVPLRSPEAQSLQTVLMVCLTLTALCSSPFATTLESGSAGHIGASTQPYAAASLLRDIVGVPVPAVAVAWSFVGGAVRRLGQRLWRRAGWGSRLVRTASSRAPEFDSDFDRRDTSIRP
jgi:hypothetical protein